MKTATFKEKKFEVVGDLDINPHKLLIPPLYAGTSAIRSRDGNLELIHVISRSAGGEVRGYVSVNGMPWKLRRPANPVHWPEVDHAIEKMFGIKISVQP